MQIMSGIAMTDGLNRKNHYFPLSTILNSYKQVWQCGTPSTLNHDSTKFAGWNYLSGIYMEPGKAYVTNRMYIAENLHEYDQLQKRNHDYLYSHYYLDRKDLFDKLKSNLSDKLSEHYCPALFSSVAYYDKGIVLRVFPKLQDYFNDGLIDINLLTPVLPGVYKLDCYLLFAHHFFRRNCSRLNSLNCEFLERLQNLRGTELKVQIALDLDLIGLAGTESAEQEYQYWWGPKFSDDLTNIPLGVTRHKNEHYDNVFSNLCFTEFGWYVQDNKQTFECEEVIDRSNIATEGTSFYGCRFVHSMVNPDTNFPNHLDGAIRAYTEEQIIDRLDVTLNKTGRNTWYTKLWRIDNDISVSLWKELITHYYRDNRLIGEYFSGKDDVLTTILLESQDEPSVVPINKYIPVDMSTGDGIRLFFKYMPPRDISSGFDVEIKADSYIVHDGRKMRAMEVETITVAKLLLRNKLNVKIPNTPKIAHEDLIFNFPNFICRDPATASTVQKTLYELCTAWVNAGYDRLISYSIIVNMGNIATKLCFAGHVVDILKMFSIVGTSVPQKDDLHKWLLEIYSRCCPEDQQSRKQKPFDLITNSDSLEFKRQYAPPRYLSDLRISGQNVVAHFTEKAEIIQEMTELGVSIAPVFLVNEMRCQKCGQSYTSCKCVKFVDDCSTDMIDCKLIGAAWTNRHA